MKRPLAYITAVRVFHQNLHKRRRGGCRHLRRLRHKVEAENTEIVDIVRGMSIPLAELPLVLQQLRAGKTLGQNVPKSEEVAAE